MAKKLSIDRLRKDIDISNEWGEENNGWGEENRGFQDEAHPSPLPDLLIDLHSSGCSYNVGQDRVTLVQKSEVGEECKEITKKKVMVEKEKEVVELLMLEKEEETPFTWVTTNLNISRAKISIAF